MWVWYLEHARGINFLLLVLIIAALTANIIARRKKANRRTRRIMMWIYAIFLNFAYGTADNLHDHVRVNPPVLVGTALLAGLLVAILWRPEGDDETPPHDNAIGTRFSLWLDHKVLEYKSRHPNA